MPVITTDALIEGIRRDDVLEWLARPEVHGRFLQAGFDSVKPQGTQEFLLTLRMGARSIQMGYRIDRADDSHGGRRVLCTTTGKRTAGKLHFSLRTMKPAKNTMVTLHQDYKAGRLLGPLLDAVGTRRALEKAWKGALEGLISEIRKDLG
jgi:hypothetical protein